MQIASSFVRRNYFPSLESEQRCLDKLCHPNSTDPGLSQVSLPRTITTSTSTATNGNVNRRNASGNSFCFGASHFISDDMSKNNMNKSKELQQTSTYSNSSTRSMADDISLQEQEQQPPPQQQQQQHRQQQPPMEMIEIPTDIEESAVDVTSIEWQFEQQLLLQQEQEELPPVDERMRLYRQESEPSVLGRRQNTKKNIIIPRHESVSATEQPKPPRLRTTKWIDKNHNHHQNDNNDRKQSKTKKYKHKRTRNKKTETTTSTTTSKERTTDRPPPAVPPPPQQTKEEPPTQTTSTVTSDSHHHHHRRRRRHRTHSPIDRLSKGRQLQQHQSLSTTELDDVRTCLPPKPIRTLRSTTTTTNHDHTYCQPKSRHVLTRQLSEGSFFSDKERKQLENLQTISKEMKHIISELTSPSPPQPQPQPIDSTLHGASFRHPPPVAFTSEHRPAVMTPTKDDKRKRTSKKTKIRETGAASRRVKKDLTIPRPSSAAAAETKEFAPIPKIPPPKKKYTLSSRRRDTKSIHPVSAAPSALPHDVHKKSTTTTLPRKDELVHLMMTMNASSSMKPDKFQKRIAESSANWYDWNNNENKKKTARNLIDAFYSNHLDDDTTSQASLDDLWCRMQSLLLDGSVGNTEATAPPSSIEDDDYDAAAATFKVLTATDGVTFLNEGGTPEHGFLKAHDATLQPAKSRSILVNAARARGFTEFVQEWPPIPKHATYSGDSTISSYSFVKQPRHTSILETDGIGDILRAKLASTAPTAVLPIESESKARLESGEHTSASEASAPQKSRSLSFESSIVFEPAYDELTLGTHLLAAPVPAMHSDGQESLSGGSSTVLSSRQLFHSLDSIEDKLSRILDNGRNRQVLLEAHKSTGVQETTMTLHPSSGTLERNTFSSIPVEPIVLFRVQGRSGVLVQKNGQETTTTTTTTRTTTITTTTSTTTQQESVERNTTSSSPVEPHTSTVNVNLHPDTQYRKRSTAQLQDLKSEWAPDQERSDGTVIRGCKADLIVDAMDRAQLQSDSNRSSLELFSSTARPSPNSTVNPVATPSIETPKEMDPWVVPTTKSFSYNDTAPSLSRHDDVWEEDDDDWFAESMVDYVGPPLLAMEEEDDYTLPDENNHLLASPTTAHNIWGMYLAAFSSGDGFGGLAQVSTTLPTPPPLPTSPSVSFVVVDPHMEESQQQMSPAVKEVSRSMSSLGSAVPMNVEDLVDNHDHDTDDIPIAEPQCVKATLLPVATSQQTIKSAAYRPAVSKSPQPISVEDKSLGSSQSKEKKEGKTQKKKCCGILGFQRLLLGRC